MEKLFEYQKEYFNSVEFKNSCEWNPKPQPSDHLPENELDVFRLMEHRHEEWTAINRESTEECFEKNILNPIWNVNKSRHTIVIEKNEEKIRIKFYYYSLVRAAGSKFYKIHTGLKFFSYNYQTNGLYEGDITNYHKKRKFQKKMRRTCPSHNPLSTIRSYILRIMSFERDAQKLSDSIFVEKTNDIFNIFLNAIPGIENYQDVKESDNRFYKMYYDKQKVKLPNNWSSLVFTYPQPKLRTIKKFKFKYIDALMSIHNLKGDKIRRALHNITNFNPSNFKIATVMFGETFILQQPDEFIKNLFESNIYLNSCNLILPPKEKKNAFEIFKLVISGHINSNTFVDHYIFYNSVIRFEKIKWKSNDFDSFGQEHLDWTERHDFYTRGDYKRIYDERFVDFSQERIFDAQDNVYYPVLLRSSKEYNEESLIQSNCVKTYIQKPSSIIISLRKDSRDSKERATIEFSIIMIKDTIYLNRVQTLGRFNQRLGDDWVVPIAILDSRIRNSFSNNGYELPKLQVKFGHQTLVANGVFKNDRPFIYLIRQNDDKKTDTYYLNWDRSLDINDSEVYYNELAPPPLQINIDDIPY